MSEQLFSQDWYRVADLKVNLRDHTLIHRQVFRGKVMYVLQDQVTGQFHRFTTETYQIIGLMNGQRNMQQIWEIACDKLGEKIPTQADVIGLLSRLYQANVIVTDRTPDIYDLDSRRKKIDRTRLLQQLKSPVSIKLPLLDPEAFLERTMPFVRPLLSKYALLLWCLVTITAFVMFLVHWESLTGNLSDRVLSAQNLLLIGLIYPFVKIFHELGHAYCVKRWGGEVHEVGIMLLVFFPVPYVDATAATAFDNKYQRMLVGSAGILVELFLAALAMILWTFIEEGTVRAILFNIMLISGVSTLLFNGNPLLRFDAYYVLADYLEIPNLATKSNKYFMFFVNRYLFNIRDLDDPSDDKKEASWLLFYSVASFLYRIFITITITLFVGSRYFIFGALIGLWFFYMAIISPLLKSMAKPYTNPQLVRYRSRIYLLSGMILTVLLLVIFMLPLPLSTHTEGVLWVPDNSRVYSEENGFIHDYPELNGKSVRPGDIVFKLDNPELQMQLKLLEKELEIARARYQASLDNKNLAEVLRENLQYVTSQYQRIQERHERLAVRAASAGKLVIADPENMIGRYFTRGEVLAYIYDRSRMPLNSMIPENDIEKVLNDTQRVEVRFVSHPQHIYDGEITRVTPSSNNILVSPVLSLQGGGKVPLDPSGSGNTTFDKYFQLEVVVKDAPESLIDERVHLLFRHGAEPLYARWYRNIRRLFLRTFSV